MREFVTQIKWEKRRGPFNESPNQESNDGTVTPRHSPRHCHWMDSFGWVPNVAWVQNYGPGKFNGTKPPEMHIWGIEAKTVCLSDITKLTSHPHLISSFFLSRWWRWWRICSSPNDCLPLGCFSVPFVFHFHCFSWINFKLVTTIACCAIPWNSYFWVFSLFSRCLSFHRSWSLFIKFLTHSCHFIKSGSRKGVQPDPHHIVHHRHHVDAVANVVQCFILFHRYLRRLMWTG